MASNSRGYVLLAGCLVWYGQFDVVVAIRVYPSMIMVVVVIVAVAKVCQYAASGVSESQVDSPL